MFLHGEIGKLSTLFGQKKKHFIWSYNHYNNYPTTWKDVWANSVDPDQIPHSDYQ